MTRKYTFLWLVTILLPLIVAADPGDQLHKIRLEEDGSGVIGVAFDGEYLWTSSAHFLFNLFKIDPSDGTILRTLEFSSDQIPKGLFDGVAAEGNGFIWAISGADKLYRINTLTNPAEIDRELDLAGFQCIFGLGYDHDKDLLLCTNLEVGVINRIDPLSGALVGTIPSLCPHGVTVDKGCIYYHGSNDDCTKEEEAIFSLSPCDGSVFNSFFSFGFGVDLAFDGQTFGVPAVWHVNGPDELIVYEVLSCPMAEPKGLGASLRVKKIKSLDEWLFYLYWSKDYSSDYYRVFRSEDPSTWISGPDYTAPVEEIYLSGQLREPRHLYYYLVGGSNCFGDGPWHEYGQ